MNTKASVIITVRWARCNQGQVGQASCLPAFSKTPEPSARSISPLHCIYLLPAAHFDTPPNHYDWKQHELQHHSPPPHPSAVAA